MPRNPNVPSPCINVCSIEEDTGLCRGCLRTLDEVTLWPRYTDEERQQVWKRLEERRLLQRNPPGHC